MTLTKPVTGSTRSIVTGGAAYKPRAITSTGQKVSSTIVTAILIIGAIYCLVPIVWVIIAATKSNGELFTTFTFAPGTGLWENIKALFAYEDHAFGYWCLNTVIYAGLGAVGSTLVSAMCGYGLAKYRFRGRKTLYLVLLAGVLIPGITLAVPQYMLMSKLELTNTMASVLIPSLISPFGIYLANVFAMASVPDEVMEAARIDGSGEFRIFVTMGLRMMFPGLVTIFLLQFIGIWNNFMLPFIMLSDDKLFPLTLGLYLMLNRGSTEAVLYTMTITGAAISVIPLLGLVLYMQRFWRLDLLSGGLKG
jgi:ABC-type sugar transport system, permease component